MFQTFAPDRSVIQPMNNVVGNEEEEERLDPFMHLRKNSTNLYNDECYEDDHFKLADTKLAKGIVKKRLRDIYKPDSPINETRYRQGMQSVDWSEQKFLPTRPTYLTQMNLLPEWHYLSLIEPQVVNNSGFYHVVAIKEGRIIKKTIDDYVYYDENTKKIVGHPMLEDKPWIHIILKAWAKMNEGYENLVNCMPFAFVRAFTYPDWTVFNPGMEELESIVSRFSSTSNNEHFYVGKTKDSDKVGYFGLIPNCASYQLTGYHQEYGNIFMVIRSLVGDKWNGRFISKQAELPSESLQLKANEFIIPLKEFINVFHLIYFTTNKYLTQKKIFYNKFSVNLDARESKAKIIRFEVVGDRPVEESVNLNIFFPSVRSFDISHKRESGKEEKSIPFCKILLGHEIEHYNNEGSYADSVREKILKNQVGEFLSINSLKYEYIMGDYFKGYANEVTYHLKLKPGRYILRLKIEKLFLEYRAIINTTSVRQVNLTEGKMSKPEQNEFLAEIFSNKSRREEKNVAYPNSSKKQSWVMINDDFKTLGYCSILFQVGKNDLRTLTVTIDAQKLKENGYRIKNKSEWIEAKHQMELKQTQSSIIILKYELEWEGKDRVWPPEGIEISYSHPTPKLKVPSSQSLAL